MFDDEDEQMYFQVFALDFAPRTVLSGTFNCVGLLTYILPQACWTEPALRRGCIALGALRVAQAQEFSDSTTIQKRDADRIHEYALEQYQRAITAMRQVKRIRTALIACILIYCIEMSVGNPELGLRQLLSGFNLLERNDCRAEHGGAGTKDRLEADLIAAYKNFETRKLSHIYLQVRCNDGINYLSTAFKANTGLVALIGVGLGPKLHEEVIRRPVLPTEFVTIDAARDYQQFDCAQRYFKWKKFYRRGETKTKTFIRIIAEAGMWTPHDKLRSTPEYIADHATLSRMFRAWFAASEKLWTLAKKTGGRDFYRMAGLRCAALSSQINHLGLLMPQSGFDKYFSHFQEIITLVEAIMKFWEQERNPLLAQLDTGIIGALMTVGFRCRHKATRDKAIAMLRSANRREGLLDSAAIALAVEFIRSLEEEESMDDFMPEENRVAVSAVWIDMQNRLLKATWDVCKHFPEKIEEERTISW